MYPASGGPVMESDAVVERRVGERAERLAAVSQLTGGIAHEFNNVLTVILASAEQLLASGGERLSSDEHASIIEILRAATRGSDSVRKLMAFARQDPLRIEPMAIDRQMRDLCRMLSRLFPATVIVEDHIAEGLPLVMADTRALQQIVRQLATNARDAMHDDGTLTVIVEARVGSAILEDDTSDDRPGTPTGGAMRHVAVVIADTGSGMNPATLAHAFEPFFTTKADKDGTGLGLAMVHGLMHQMGGSVAISSTVNVGTTVTLRFPVAEVGVPPQRTAETMPLRPSRQERVLVIEDDPAIRALTARTLRSNGFLVIEASDGEEAAASLALARQNGSLFDLVISDVVMPRGGGARVLSAVAAMAPDARILWITGFSSRGSGSDGIGPPSDDPVLQKPWTLGDLLNAVRAAMDGPPVGRTP